MEGPEWPWGYWKAGGGGDGGIDCGVGGDVKANKSSFFPLPPDPITPFLGRGDERLLCNWRGGNKYK